MRVLSRSKNAALRGPSAAIDLDDHRVALASARADRGAAEAAAATAQLIDQGAEDARARGADGMAQRDRPAVDVDLVLVDAEHPDRVERDRGEGLVDLPQVDVLSAQAGLLQRLLRRLGRGAGKVGEVVG